MNLMENKFEDFKKSLQQEIIKTQIGAKNKKKKKN